MNQREGEGCVWVTVQFSAFGFLVVCAFSAVSLGNYIDTHAAIHASGTVASTGIIIDANTSRTVRILSKSIHLPPVRRFSAYFYLHVEFPSPSFGSGSGDGGGDSKSVVEWKPEYALWCYPKHANLAAEAPFFGLGLSTLDIAKEGTYKIDIHVRVPVPVELLEGNKCILAEEGSVARSELRWELHLVPEWRWFNVLPRLLVDEVIHAMAVMGVSYEAPPGHGATWHDGTDMPNGIEIHRRRSIEAFMQAVDAGAFINRTFQRATGQ